MLKVIAILFTILAFRYLYYGILFLSFGGSPTWNRFVKKVKQFINENDN